MKAFQVGAAGFPIPTLAPDLQFARQLDYTPSMIWFPLALSAAVCWAVGAVLVKRGFSSVPPLWNNVINNALSL
jgi:drug/metabolite transporter (DMT)-like permease